MRSKRAGRWPRILASTLILVMLAGCGLGRKVADLVTSDDDAVQPAELVEFTPSLEVARAWTGSVGKGSDDHYLKLTPAVLDGVVLKWDAIAIELEDDAGDARAARVTVTASVTFEGFTG